ncbi:DUF3086 domain-containing protein [Synechococcus sp. J7-Johnson]|uniref:DUF3086 domain-containing protein n=1 Tax=Synechococcus sp. J7-Johnson TaxID=2823737 RepID=UPI0020CFADC2|nr:DUF3086 domain-containing protein [Synechococcus sp. J7-Johnson]MCP9840741.1 DUF3086 domain-containing protein [Synechococcus sp. J7-Johnson]
MSDITPIPETGSEPLPEPEAAAASSAAAEPIASAQPAAHGELLELALSDLRERRAALLSEIQALEQRRKQLDADLDGSLSGRADGIARRLKGFQDYLVVALQDLASQAELMDLVVQPLQVQPSPLDPQPEAVPTAAAQQIAPAAAGQFSQDAELIRDRLARFQGQPDFYADPWKLRRSLEPAAAGLLEDWFLNQGGRGAQASTGSRNRNALITAGAVAILGDLYGDRFQTLVLAGEPERLGEWRRGLQDCLGLAREDFGPNSGIVLFERPDALIERADRLEERGELPFIVIDAAEQVVDIPVLQFPLWLAFAATANELALEQDLP